MRSRVGIDPPRSADVLRTVEHDEVVDAGLFQSDRSSQPTESRADDEYVDPFGCLIDVVDRKLHRYCRPDHSGALLVDAAHAEDTRTDIKRCQQRSMSTFTRRRTQPHDLIRHVVRAFTDYIARSASRKEHVRRVADRPGARAAGRATRQGRHGPSRHRSAGRAATKHATRSPLNSTRQRSSTLSPSFASTGSPETLESPKAPS